MGHYPKMFQFENWNPIKTATPQILAIAMPQTRNNIEVTVWSVFFHSCYNIHNLFQFFIFAFPKRVEGG